MGVGDISDAEREDFAQSVALLTISDFPSVLRKVFVLRASLAVPLRLWVRLRPV